MATLQRTGPAPIGEIVHRITDDVKTIASDEIQLVKLELSRTVKATAMDTAIVVLGGVVALLGFGMLCITVVVALAPVIPALWLRLLIVAIAYLVVGSVIAGLFARKLGHDAKPDVALPVYEAKKTIDNIKQGLQG